MADISAVRSAIQSRLSTLLGSTGNAYAYWQPSPDAPSFQVVGFSTDFDSTFKRGSDVLICTVQGISHRGLDETAQRQIDDWCDGSGSTSVKAAIETERPSPVTLGSTVSSCRVTGHSRPAITTMNDGTECWTVDFTLEIQT